jgi:hypothetical protein
MENVQIEVRVPGPRLPVVLRELVEGICADDWHRLSTEDQGRFYYIVGEHAAGVNEADPPNFNISEFPGEKPTESSKPPSPLAEAYVRSQIAGDHPDYLQRARRRLEQAGVNGSIIDVFLKGKNNLSDWPREVFLGEGEMSRAFLDFLEACRVLKQRPLVLDRQETGEVDITREKIYLKEVCHRYEKMVDRSVELEPLPFEDPQLEEASECFLYGFYRAAVVLSAAAIETHLKAATKKEWFKQYKDLVNSARWQGKLTNELCESAEFVFKKRNIVHKDDPVGHDDAQEVLVQARNVINHIKSTS